MTEDDYTRFVTPSGYTLGLCPTGRTGQYGKVQMAYFLDDPARRRLFEGTDFYPSPLHACDGSEAAASLLAFLTLRPGDTDDEYFDSYTPEQIAWAESADCEELSYFVSDVEEGLIDWPSLED